MAGVGHTPELLRFMHTLEVPDGEFLGPFLRRYDDELNAVAVPVPDPEIVTISQSEGWDLRAAIWEPAGQASAGAGRSVVLFCHGGGWVGGNHLSHRGFAAELAFAGHTVVAVDYRRAPKWRFPAAYDDCERAAAWCLERYTQVDGAAPRLTLAGDSAGANLAAAVVAASGIAVDAALLLYGIYDYVTVLQQMGAIEGQPYVEAAALDDLRNDPRLNPLAAANRFPRTFIGVGSRDRYLEESRKLSQHLSLWGVSHTFREYAGVPHGYIQLPRLDAYPAALAHMLAFLDEPQAPASNHG